MNTALLGDVCEIIMGQAPSGETYNSDGIGLPLIAGAGDFGSLFPQPNRYTTAPSKKTLVGDIILCVRATIGDLNWADREYCLGRGVAGIRPKNNLITPEYAWWTLNSNAAKLLSMGRGATFKQINKSDIEGLEIRLPSINEQNRIAAILDKADEVRFKRRQALEKLEGLAQAVFVEMFGEPVANPNKLPLKKLGEICDVRDGTHDSPKYVSEGYPLVTSKNLTQGRIDLSEVNLISESDYQNINKRSKVDQGDILMPMIGTIGNPIIVDSEPNFAIKNVALIKFSRNKVSNVYIHTLLNGPYFDAVSRKKNRGGTQKFMSLGDIRGIDIPLANHEDQIAFERRVLDIKLLKEKLEKSNVGVEQMFSSLQQRAFKGEL